MKLYARIQSTRSAFFPAGFAPQPGECDDDCLRSPSTPAVLTDTLSATRVPAQAPSAWMDRETWVPGVYQSSDRTQEYPARHLGPCRVRSAPLMQRFPVWPVSVPALSLRCDGLLRAIPAGRRSAEACERHQETRAGPQKRRLRGACLSPDGPFWKLADSVVEYSWRCFSVLAVSWFTGLIPPFDQAHTAAKQATYARSARSVVAEFRVVCGHTQ